MSKSTEKYAHSSIFSYFCRHIVPYFCFQTFPVSTLYANVCKNKYNKNLPRACACVKKSVTLQADCSITTVCALILNDFGSLKYFFGLNE